MGITIYYAFVRRQEPQDLNQQVEKLVRSMGMKIMGNSDNHLAILPHPKCESINLEWRQWKSIKGMPKSEANYWQNVKLDFSNIHEDEWVCIGFTKTQYAGIKCHREVCEVLRFVSAHCSKSAISDEAEHYEMFGESAYEKAKKNFDASTKLLSIVAGTLKEVCGKENVRVSLDEQ